MSIENDVLSACMLDSENMLMALERGVSPSWFTSEKLFKELVSASSSTKWNQRNSMTVLQGSGVFGKCPEAMDIAADPPSWAFKVEDVGNAIEVLAQEHSGRLLSDRLTVSRNRLAQGDDVYVIAGGLMALSEEIDTLSGGSERTTEDVVSDALEMDRKVAEGACMGLPFPWVNFQGRTFGIPYKAVTPMGGRDGKGKSRLATFLTTFWVSQGIPILYFAFEDSAERFVSNVASSLGGYDMFTIKRDHVPVDFMPRHENTMAKVKELPLYVEDYPCSAEKLVSTIARYKRKYDIKGVVVDGFKDIIPSTGENQTSKENHMTAVLVRAAKRYEVAQIPISHINTSDDVKWISRRALAGAG